MSHATTPILTPASALIIIVYPNTAAAVAGELENKFNKSRSRAIALMVGIILISIPIYEMISGGEIHKPFIGPLTLGAALICGGLFGYGGKKEINKKLSLAFDAVTSVGLGIVVYVLSGSLEVSLIITVANIIYSLRVLAY